MLVADVCFTSLCCPGSSEYLAAPRPAQQHTWKTRLSRHYTRRADVLRITETGDCITVINRITISCHGSKKHSIIRFKFDEKTSVRKAHANSIQLSEVKFMGLDGKEIDLSNAIGALPCIPGDDYDQMTALPCMLYPCMLAAAVKRTLLCCAWCGRHATKCLSNRSLSSLRSD